VIKWGGLLKNSDEHRRYVLQKVLGLGVLEESPVLLQFVRDLINNKTATRRQRIICFLQERAFLFDFKDTERNTRKNIVTAIDSMTLQFVRQRGCITVNHTHAPVASKLALQVARERSVQLKQKQM